MSFQLDERLARDALVERPHYQTMSSGGPALRASSETFITPPHHPVRKTRDHGVAA